MKWIKIGWIMGLVIVILTVVGGFLLSLKGVQIAYLVASEVVILIALLRGVHLAQKDTEEE